MVYRTPTRSVPALWLSSVGTRSDLLIHLVEQGLRSAHAIAVKPKKLDRSPTGTSQLMLDPHDPWPTGYRLGDTWPKMPTN